MDSITRTELAAAVAAIDDLTDKQAADFTSEIFEHAGDVRLGLFPHVAMFAHDGYVEHSHEVRSHEVRLDHDGYVEHSHEVRPDHEGVERQVPDNCTHGFDANGEYIVRSVRTKADDIAQAKEMREGEARESTRPVTLAEFQAQNTMQGLTITGVIEELEALRAQVATDKVTLQSQQANITNLWNDLRGLQRQVANGPNAPYTN
jgi:hypothetical protein